MTGRILLAVVFLGVLLGVVAGGHAYLAQRLVRDAAPPSPGREIALVALGALAATLALQPIADRLLPRRVARPLAWVASVWMGSAYAT